MGICRPGRRKVNKFAPISASWAGECVGHSLSVSNIIQYEITTYGVVLKLKVSGLCDTVDQYPTIHQLAVPGNKRAERIKKALSNFEKNTEPYVLAFNRLLRG
ncbi:hypothetical protein AP1_0467 [Aeromonas phage AP1]|nr:hypothetical protein AP1_0467 [Aeromonas phage AP1]